MKQRVKWSKEYLRPFFLLFEFPRNKNISFTNFEVFFTTIFKRKKKPCVQNHVNITEHKIKSFLNTVLSLLLYLNWICKGTTPNLFGVYLFGLHHHVKIALLTCILYIVSYTWSIGELLWQTETSVFLTTIFKQKLCLKPCTPNIK